MTYALLAERAPQARRLARDEALAELARRYFVSRGPATLKDFAWWSGLPAADARAGLEMVKSTLEQATWDRNTYWFAGSPGPDQDTAQVAYLLPNYDENIFGYTDRSAVFDARHTPALDVRGNVVFQHTVLAGHEIVSTWKRTLRKDALEIEVTPFFGLSAPICEAVVTVAADYARFLGLPTANVTFGMNQHADD